MSERNVLIVMQKGDDDKLEGGMDGIIQRVRTVCEKASCGVIKKGDELSIETFLYKDTDDHYNGVVSFSSFLKDFRDPICKSDLVYLFEDESFLPYFITEVALGYGMPIIRDFGDRVQVELSSQTIAEQEV